MKVAWVSGLLSLVLVFTGSATAATWEDYGEIWSPDTGKISLLSIVMDLGRFGEQVSTPAGAPLYKMYYSDGVYPECNEIHLTASPDGITWSFVGSVLTQGKRPAVVYSAAGFGNGEAKYRMWYTVAASEEERQQTTSFRVCESTDGLQWSEPLPCADGDPARPVVASGDDPEAQAAWNRGSYGIVRVLFNAEGLSTANPDAPMSNRYVMYYNTYGIDAQSEREGGPLVTSSLAMAVSADGVRWYRVGDAPVLRGLPSVTGGMITFADVAKQGEQYVLCYMVESMPAHGYTRRIGQAVSPDGVHWTVTDSDVAVLKTDDGDKGTYGLALAVATPSGELQIWLAAGDGAGRLCVKYGRQEE